MFHFHISQIQTLKLSYQKVYGLFLDLFVLTVSLFTALKRASKSPLTNKI